MLGSSSDAAANAAAVEAAFRAQDGFRGGDGGVGSNSAEEDKIISNYSGGGGGGGEEFGDKSFGGNRWPRQETLALLKIRSDMDMAFRDASVKGPLWDEVSRKLAELGFHRSAKKCKEKFENVYKYHRRTKEGRTGKSEGKTYRFFDQLQALENQPPTPNSTTNTHRTNATEVSNTPCPAPPISHVNSSICTNSANLTVPSSAVPMTNMPTQGIAPISVFTPTNPTILPPQPLPPPQATFANPTTPHQTTLVSPPSFPMGTSSNDDIRSNSTSSSTSSDDEMEGRAKRKRKWKDFFERLLKEVVHKQEDLQNRFLEVIEKRERDRMAREEAWRMQEIARINRERDILNQERSITAAKDAAVMSFLQKMSEQQPHPFQSTQNNINNINNLLTSQPQQQQSLPLPPPAQQSAPPPPSATTPPALQIIQAPLSSFEILPRPMNGNGGETNLGSPTTPSSSRWPKVEVHSLIKIRTGMDSKYQENGPKGPLWEEISSAMKNLGYNRSAKRCKEKWENINKYFKKVKESNKKRPEDSKTCPYFHLLDSLYRERNKFDNPITNSNSNNNSSKPAENAVPLMVRPEQQWQPPAVLQDRVEPEMENEPMDQNHEEEDEEDEDDDDEEDEGNYEIVANKGASASVSVSVSVSAAE